MTQIVTIAGAAPHTGSGFVYKYEHVMTAAHVINTQVNPTVFVEEGGKFWAGTVTSLDNARDIATLHVPGLPFKPFRMAKNPALPDAKVILRSLWGTQSGIVRGLYQGMYTISCESEVKFGTSGGAVLNDAGQVIGVVSARYNDDPTICLASKA